VRAVIISDSVSAKQCIDQIAANVAETVIGKPHEIMLTIAAMLAGGHVLFEDIPGVGKTTLVRSLANALQLPFQRIQFTPDLLPSDIIGVTIYDESRHDFSFREGPVFTTVLLADEINRATPRAQAALLEAMAERRVTVDGTTYDLSPDFFVLATQNPTDYEGTYPLPEAQIDRFLFRLSLGYPDRRAEQQLLSGADPAAHIHDIAPVIATDDLKNLKQMAATVHVSEALIDYIWRLINATRQDPRVRLGISPRGGMALVSAAKAYALCMGREYVLSDDVQAVLAPTFHHRLILNQGSNGEVDPVPAILQDILRTTTVPVE
jgi:MoxR-like ATPase